mgnify:CR=1 FL=1
MKSTYRELVRQGFGFTNLNYTAVFSYDAAGRLVREGDKTYRYGYLDKVLSVTDGKRSYRYAYHVDGQLARADYGDGGRAGSPLPAGSEAFHWDGLALVRRGDESFVNEPHAGDAPKKLRSGGKPRAKRSARRARKGPRGNPVVSSKGVAYLNDALGTTLGVKTKQGRKYSAAAMTAFGAGDAAYFTGKPQIPGLGRAFLFRNYRPDLGKWQTADPLGYPDGWNRFAYGPNSPLMGVDIEGARWVTKTFWYADEYTDFVVLPGGLPLDMPGISPNAWQEVFNYFAGSGATIITNFALEIMKPLWDRYKAEINARDATIAEAEAERVGRKGFEDYEVYSVGYFSASSDAEYIAEAIQIHHMSVTWEVVCRKWEE